MRTTRIAMLLLLGGLVAAGRAFSQEPPPYQGGDQAQPGDEQAPPPDYAAQQPGDEPAPVDDPAVAGVEYFHHQLSPYGRWVEREGYGYVWVPRIHAGWRPYTTGHWVYTDQGWAWVADEPWGWAAFHYGRWFYDPGIGWAWVPGTVWAPAWVAWRHGGGYLGWAPLGPAVGFSAGVGLNFGGVVISAGFFTFVGERDILAPRCATVILPSTRNVTIINNTTNITNYTVVNNRVVNNGVSVQRIEQVTGRPVQRVQVAALASASSGGHPGAFYQPPVVAKAARVSHAEFGHALPAQVAVQQKSRVFSRSATGATSTPATGAAGTAGARGSRGAAGSNPATGQAATGTVTGRRQHGQAVSGQGATNGASNGQGQASGQAQSHSGGQATGRRTHVPKATGTAGGQAQGESVSGTGSRPPHNTGAASGEPSHPKHTAPPSGQSQAAQPPPRPPHQQAPPPARKKTPPPPPKDKETPPPLV